MKVVLAGGSGLIGRAISAALIDAGHEPVVLTRRIGKFQPGVRMVAWNARSGGDWEAELAGARAVINLAGASIGRWPWTARRKTKLLESRLSATRALVEAIERMTPAARPTVFLSASGTDLYEGQDASPADETTPPADTFLGRLCLAWETEAMRASALGLRVVLMRTSSVIAPGAPVLRILALPLRLFVGGRLGSGRQWASWVDIADAIGLYLWAIESEPISGPVNVAAPDPRRQAEFVRALGAAIGRPVWFRTPAWVIRLVLRDQATLVLGSRRIWPGRALAAGYRFSRPRLEESLRHAFAPTDEPKTTAGRKAAR
jgi:uncharacterized protein (TIGR01777 family)